MPIMNGFDLTSNIRKYLTKKLKVPEAKQPFIIGVTGHVEENFRAAGLKAGMNEVQSKPIYKKEVEAIFKRYKIETDQEK